MSPARLKGDWTSWRDTPRAANAGTRRSGNRAKVGGAQRVCSTQRQSGYVVPDNKTLGQVPKGSELPAKLAELGCSVAAHGTITRVAGAQPVSRSRARYQNGAVRLTEMDVLIRLTDGDVKCRNCRK
jgi:hypothetical protein